MKNKSELNVITIAKDLCSYILTVTDNSPKKFRFTLTIRLQNYALDVVYYLNMANDVYMRIDDRQLFLEAVRMRRSYQKRALAYMKQLSFLSHVAMERKCILPRQYEQISKQLFDCERHLGGWMTSDNQRFSSKGK